MRFAFDEDQEALQRSARRFLERHAPVAEARRAAALPRGYDPELWRRICADLGWSGLIVPEAHGGFGFGHVGVTALMEEMGRVLLCSPFLATVCLGANALIEAGTEAQRAEWLPAIVAGEATATVAHAGGTLVAHPHGAGFVLAGERTRVVDGDTADLVLALTDDGGLFAVPGAALVRHQRTSLDPTRRFAAVQFDRVEVGAEARLPGTVDRVLDLARAALAAEQVGGAAACLEQAVEYAKTRVQFGRPIGSFQAIKHICADLLLQVESARSAAWSAGWAAAEAPEELPISAAVAQAWCSEAFFQCAAENIQIHGGVGFTWEHDAHLYFKKAEASRQLLGAPQIHRERVAQEIGL